MAKKMSDDRASKPDEENPEWTQADFKRARPASEILPALIGERATQDLLRNKGGRPVKADKKISQTLRLDPEVLEAYKREGAGWQTRINQVLRDHMPGSHK
jgi:uncharacterized protein (DUF4415 family)